MSLQQQAVNGVKWTSFATVFKAVIQLTQLAVAARFLSPEDFGLFALVQLVIGFCQLFTDMGIGNAIIHQQKVEKRHLSELFSVNLAVGLFLSAIVYLAAPNIANFFNNIALTSPVEVISITFILSACFRIHLVTLQKALAFDAIAKIELFAVFVGFWVVVIFSYQGFGVWALVYGYLSNLTIQLLLFTLFSKEKLRIKRVKSWQELKNYLSFGVYQTGDSTVNYFNSQFDVILVGKLFGAEVLGGYSLARQFCFRPAMVINPVLTRVAFPVMSRLQRSPKLATVYCKLIGLLSAINFPIYIAMAFFAEEIVLTLFGVNWLHIVPVFQLLSLWCLVRSIKNPVGALLMATGKVKKALKWNLCLFLFIPASIYLGSNYGTEGVALSLFLLQLLLVPGHWYFLLNKTVGIPIRAFIGALALPLIIAIISAIFSWVITQSLSSWLSFANLSTLSLGVILGGLIYFSLSFKFNPLVNQLVKRELTFE